MVLPYLYIKIKDIEHRKFILKLSYLKINHFNLTATVSGLSLITGKNAGTQS